MTKTNSKRLLGAGLVAGLLWFGVGCAASIPDLGTAEAHRQAAAEHQARAAEYARRYDPNAKSTGNTRRLDLDVAVAQNPTARWLERANEEKKLAELHLEAADEKSGALPE